MEGVNPLIHSSLPQVTNTSSQDVSVNEKSQKISLQSHQILDQIPSVNEQHLNAKSIIPIPTVFTDNSPEQIKGEVLEIETAIEIMENLSEPPGDNVQKTRNPNSFSLHNPAHRLVPMNELLRTFSTSQSSFEATLKNANLDKVYENLSDAEKGKINEGLDFFQSLIPMLIIENKEKLGCEKHIKAVEKLGNFYLNALVSENSDKNLIATYQMNLLNASEKLYEYLNENLDKILKNNTTKGQPPISDNIKIHIKQLLNKWHIELQMQKSQLDPEIVKLGISVVSSTISGATILLNNPFFTLIPSQVAIQIIAGTLDKLSGALKIFRILVLSIEVLIRNKQVKKLDQWIGKFETWKQQQQSFFLTQKQTVSNAAVLDNKTLTKKFNDLINKSSIEEIKLKLLKVGIDLGDSFKTRRELKTKLESNTTFKNEMMGIYIDFHKRNSEFNQTIQNAKNLLEKRMALQEKNFFKAQPHFERIHQKLLANSLNIIFAERQKTFPSKEIIDKELAKWEGIESLFSDENSSLDPLMSEKKQEEFFRSWCDSRSDVEKDKLLADYVDKQSMIDVSLKGSLTQMISKKHEIESILTNFKLKSAQTYLLAALATFGAFSAITLIGSAFVTLPGLAFLGLLVSMGSVCVTVGLVGASLYLGFKYTPKTALDSFKGLALRMFYVKSRMSVRKFIHNRKLNKMIATATFLDKLDIKASNFTKPKNAKVYAIASRDLNKQREALIKSEKQLNNWNEKLEKLESQRLLHGWQDFAAQADLEVVSNNLDGLGRISVAILEADFDLLSKDTKYLLAVQTGMDIKTLGGLLKNSSKNNQDLEKEFKGFVSSTDFSFSQFHKKQNKLLQKGFLKTPSSN